MEVEAGHGQASKGSREREEEKEGRVQFGQTRPSLTSTRLRESIPPAPQRVPQMGKRTSVCLSILRSFPLLLLSLSPFPFSFHFFS